MDVHTQHLYKQLVELRHAKKLSQRELAGKLNLPQSYVSKIESGKLNIQLANYLDLVRYLGAEVMVVPLPLVPIVTAMIGSQSVSADTQKRPVWAISDNNNVEENE